MRFLKPAPTLLILLIAVQLAAGSGPSRLPALTLAQYDPPLPTLANGTLDSATLSGYLSQLKSNSVSFMLWGTTGDEYLFRPIHIALARSLARSLSLRVAYMSTHVSPSPEQVPANG